MRSDDSGKPNSADAFDPSDRHDITDPSQRWTFSSPAQVFDANGQQIGVLSLASPGDYLVVQRDGDPDLYIPLSAVNRSDTSGVYLSLTLADLQGGEWLSPPTT